MKAYPNKVVSSLLIPDPRVKVEQLGQFIEFCSYDLFFEGFAVPSCLYALDFIQAYLVRAWAGRENTLSIMRHQPAAVIKTKESKQQVKAQAGEYDHCSLKIIPKMQSRLPEEES